MWSNQAANSGLTLWSKVTTMMKRTGTLSTLGDKQKRQAKGKEEKEGKRGDGDASKGGFKVKCSWCERMEHRASKGNKKTTYHRGQGENSIHQVKEDGQERHVQFEEETYTGTLDAGPEHVEQHENDANANTRSRTTATPASGLTPQIIKRQYEEIMAMLRHVGSSRGKARKVSPQKIRHVARMPRYRPGGGGQKPFLLKSLWVIHGGLSHDGMPPGSSGFSRFVQRLF